MPGTRSFLPRRFPRLLILPSEVVTVKGEQTGNKMLGIYTLS